MSFFSRLPVCPLGNASADSSSVCFTTYVYGDYILFIPYYIYSVLKSYPSCFCKIYISGSMPDKVSCALSLIESHLSSRFEIKQIQDVIDENIEEVLRKYNCLPGMRWFLPMDEFKDFKYVYYGDVDFLIVPESPSLALQHIKHMDYTGAPFSNACRKDPRLTGLHFVEVERYSKQIIKYGGMPKENILRSWLEGMPKQGCDERLLYNFVGNINSDLNFLNGEKFRPYHGFHFAAARKSILNLALNDTRHTNIPSDDGFFGHNMYSRKELFGVIKKNYFSDKLFRKIFILVDEPSVNRTYLLLNGFSFEGVRAIVRLMKSFCKKLMIWPDRILKKN